MTHHKYRSLKEALTKIQHNDQSLQKNTTYVLLLWHNQNNILPLEKKKQALKTQNNICSRTLTGNFTMFYNSD